MKPDLRAVFVFLCCWASASCSEDTPGGGSGGSAGAMPSSGGAGGAGGSAASGGASGAMSTGGSGGSSVSGGAGGSGGGGGGGGGGASGASGAMSTGGSSGDGGDGGTGGASGDAGMPPEELEPFSFFVTSYEAMVRLSGTEDGFGGDLRYGEADGLSGADKICTEIAEYSMPGAGAKGWRAFLSVADGPDGRVDAIDRIGDGPWYDRQGRIVAENTEALQNTRPEGAHSEIVNDLPNEYGIGNHRPDPTMPEVDNHHVLTGSGPDGRLYEDSVDGTCNNWTALEDAGRPRIGFSWPVLGSRENWISGQDEGGCGAGFDLDGGGGSDPNNPIVGSGGGYGGIYCFALMP